MNTSPAYFDRLYEVDDPYGYRLRWYETRKRALTLAALPSRHYESAWDMGCSNGELTADLAPRCVRVYATDGNARAVALASARTKPLGNVLVERSTQPVQWPTGLFDLIVFSEIGYFMSESSLDETIEKCRDSLSPDGTFVACHWKRPFAEAPMHGASVHRAIDAGLGRPRVFSYDDEDFILQGWSNQPSVAQKEGIP